LASQLGSFEALSQGSVMYQAPRAWRWTRKVGGKTVSLGLKPGQAERMKQAIANQRALNEMIDEMREITQKLILETPENTPIPHLKNRPNAALS
jgi:predicted flavoprotein YhiN